MIRQASIVCIALLWAASVAGAEVTHPDIPRHQPHAAESRSPHEAEKRHPHEAAKHAKPQKPPKRAVAAHEDSHKVAKH